MTLVAGDVLVRHGRVLLEGRGLVACDLLVRDGKIAGFFGTGDYVRATRVIDASDLVVFPGVIDAHVHFGLGFPDDYASESRAAARGGITTVLNYVSDARSYLERFPEERTRVEQESIVDVGLHVILMNAAHLSEVSDYVGRLGVPSFKYFMNFKGQEGAYMGVEGTDTGFFFELCEAVARHPEAVLAVHTENIEIVWRLARRLQGEGRDGLSAWAESRPDFVESIDMATALILAEQTRCRMYIPHVSSALALQMYRDHRARGGRGYIETCPHYLTHTKDSDVGGLAKVNPPVRTQRDADALWAAITDGTVAVVGSDHNSRPKARKQGSIWKASAGFPGVTTLLPVLLSEGYHRRELSLQRIAALVSGNPARIFGLYPTKGCLAVGSDADLTLVDLDAERLVDSSTFESHADYSIYDHTRLRGWPVATMLRGRVTMRDGDILVAPGAGRFVFRPVDAWRPQGGVETER